MKKSVLTILLLVFLVTACGSIVDRFQSAVDQTLPEMGPAQTNQLPSANTFEPPSTLPPTETIAPIPSEPQILTPSLSLPPDNLIIKIDPRTFLMEVEDLPIKAQYYLPGPEWISPHLNEEILQSWGAEDGLEYLNKTGRIDGWVVSYKRGNDTLVVPREIYHNIIMYATSEGAAISRQEYPITAHDEREDGYEKFDREVDIGGSSDTYLRKVLQDNGKYRVWYRIETVYRNYISVIVGWGWVEEVDYKYIEAIGRKIIQKLEAAPLGAL